MIDRLLQGDPEDQSTMTGRPEEQRLDVADAGRATASNQEPIDIQEVSRDEAQRLDDALSLYNKSHFAPLKKKVSFWKDVGPQVAGLLISGAGAILISALRVGTILFIAEMSLAVIYNKVADATTMQWLGNVVSASPLLIGVAGLFTFEGYLFSHGYNKGKESGQTSTNLIGVGVAFFVTISAGTEDRPTCCMLDFN